MVFFTHLPDSHQRNANSALDGTIAQPEVAVDSGTAPRDCSTASQERWDCTTKGWEVKFGLWPSFKVQLKITITVGFSWKSPCCFLMCSCSFEDNSLCSTRLYLTTSKGSCWDTLGLLRGFTSMGSRFVGNDGSGSGAYNFWLPVKGSKTVTSFVESSVTW